VNDFNAVTDVTDKMQNSLMHSKSHGFRFVMQLSVEGDAEAVAAASGSA
jgi:hypothetical protein